MILVGHGGYEPGLGYIVWARLVLFWGWMDNLEGWAIYVMGKRGYGGCLAIWWGIVQGNLSDLGGTSGLVWLDGWVLGGH